MADHATSRDARGRLGSGSGRGRHHLHPARAPYREEASEIDEPIERDEELLQINELLRAAKDRRGQMAVIEAPSGMGKSTLLSATRRLAEDAGLQVVEAAGSELEVEYPFGTMLQLFHGYRARIDAAMEDHLFRGQAALARPLLGESDGADAATEFSIIHGLYWCVVNVSEIRPTVLLVDDVHWADDESLRCFNYLSSRLADLPVVLVLAVRTGDARSDGPLVRHLSTASSIHPIRLESLTPQAAEVLLHRQAPDVGLTSEAVRRCWEVTGGNPFLLRELANAVQADGPDWLNDPDRLGSFAPESVRRQVLQRLTRLGDDAVELSRAVAVLGNAARLDLAGRLAGLELDVAATEVDRLVTAQVLRDASHPSFFHPMIRAAIYEDLPPGHLATAHAACAELLHATGESAETVAPHLLLGLPITDDWAVDCLRDAGRAAYRKGSAVGAIRYLRHAIRLCRPGPRQASIMADLALMEAAYGEIRSAVEHLQQAVRHMEDPVEQARCQYSLGVTLARIARFDEAVHALQQSALAAREHNPGLALQAEGLWVFVAYYLNRADPAVLERLDEMLTEFGDQAPRTTAEGLLVALGGLRASLVPGRSQDAARMALAGLSAGQGSRGAAGAVLVHIAAMTLTFTEHFDEAAEAAGSLLAAARAQGSLPAIAETAFVQSLVNFGRGNITDTWVSLETALETVGTRHGLAPMASGILAICLVERDQLDEAAAILDGTDTNALSADNPGPGAWLRMARGHLDLARGNPASALEEFRSVGRALSVCHADSPGVLRWRTGAALAATRLGDADQARSLAGEEVSLARTLGLPRAEGAALRTAATVAADPTNRRRLLEASLAVLEPDGPSLDLGQTLLEQGREMYEAGDTLGARGPLTRALDLAHRFGGIATARRAREALLATGAKPRRPHAGGIHSLTPTELRVAEMAAGGLTNREIAEQLFLAKTTVAWHLRNVFRKLEIESRADLSAELPETWDPEAV